MQFQANFWVNIKEQKYNSFIIALLSQPIINQYPIIIYIHSFQTILRPYHWQVKPLPIQKNFQAL